MRLLIFSMTVLPLLFCGCVQSMQNTSVSKKKDIVLLKTTGSAISPPTRKISYTRPEYPIEECRNTSQSYASDISNEKTEPALDEALDFCTVSQDFWQKGELEKALDALDQAYSLILEVDTEDSPRLIQQKEDLRFMISKRILEIYASRNIVVTGKHNAIPMIMNKHVQAEIDFLLKSNGKRKSFFAEAYKRSGKYRAQIVEELKKAGLPPELSWLPLIESGYRVYALSNARALGLWQFIPSTGSKFGLNRDKYVDERLDPEKSTKAAVAYLKALHNIFGDWATVLAAYNCGEGRVLRVIRSQNVNYLDNFWDLYERLPRETARYVPRFLATLHIIRNPEKYGLNSIPLCSPLEYETIAVEKQVHLRDAAKAMGLSEEILKELNPELRHNIVPGHGNSYALKVPLGGGEQLLAKLNFLPAPSLPAQVRRTYKYHRVRKGETLSVIAKRYGTSVKTIRSVNKLNKRGYIVAGKILRIPQTGKAVRKSAQYAKRKRKAPSKHLVKSGDSLWIIARRYGTTTKEIRRLNRLSHSKLHIGQVLKLPGTGSVVSKNKTPNISKDKNDVSKVYRVRRGDVPLEIAKRHNMPLHRLLQVNHLSKRSKIYPGQKLYVD